MFHSQDYYSPRTYVPFLHISTTVNVNILLCKNHKSLRSSYTAYLHIGEDEDKVQLRNLTISYSIIFIQIENWVAPGMDGSIVTRQLGSLATNELTREQLIS